MANILNKNQEILLSIKRIGINGEGIGYYKRLAVFVPNTLPGEVAEVRITEIFDQYARGMLLRIKGEPSPNRIKPNCLYYEKCGGCNLQHMNYDTQLQIKKNLVMEAFDRYYDKELNIKVFKDTIGTEHPWRYRNKAKLPVRYDGEKLVTGLYAIDSNRLVYIDDCIVEKEDIRITISKICDYLTKYQVIAFNPKSHDGILRHIVIRSSSNTSEIQVTLILFKDDARTIKIAKGLLDIDNIVSVYISINDDLDSLENFGNDTKLLVGKTDIIEKIDNLSFHLQPTSFFQLNLEQTEKLYNEIVKIANFHGNENVVDAYCGVGAIGMKIAPHVKKVIGIDVNKESIENAIENAKLNNINNIEFLSGEVQTHIGNFKKYDFEPNVFVVDPPRSGLTQNILRYLQANPIDKIIYVSCNPATLAKNCNHLANKYYIKSVQPLDMFPQTANVECVVCLERK